MRSLVLAIVAAIVVACASLEVLAEHSARLTLEAPSATSAPALLEP